MTSTPRGPDATVHPPDVLREIEQRVLWLATAIVAPRQPRATQPERASRSAATRRRSASMVTIMTALWFEHLRAEDRVSVKPHASPVLHAINYLLGELDERYLTTLRAFGGLQSYPSRAKDPDPVDYSTGSVGIGATAPIWGALARRYVSLHGGRRGHGPPVLAGRRRRAGRGRGAGRRSSTRWSASSARSCWIVDLNRQSLDRVVPNIGATRLQGMFDAAGWQVLTVKYGRLLRGAVRPGPAGRRCGAGSTRCPTRSTSGCCAAPRPSCASGSPATTREVRALIAELDDDDAARRDPQPRRARPRRARRRLRRDRRHPAHGDLRVHGQGLRPGERGSPAEPLLAADRRADGQLAGAPVRRVAWTSRGRGSRRLRRRGAAVRR